MASQDRRQARALEVQEALEREPHRFDLFRALRLLECAFPERPRLGEATRPAEEPVRLGQEPSLAFAARSVAAFTRGGEHPPRLTTFAFGVFGPNGPLPLHLTEYARDRLRHAGDATLARFLDVFHHRLLTLFYRAYADAEPAVARDRPAADRFPTFLGALVGIGLPATRGRSLTTDDAKLHYAGLLARQARNADGLAALVGDLFRAPARVEEFVGEWVDLPAASRSRLGQAGCTLGVDAVVGARTWLRSGRFRLVLGPLRRREFDGFLPGSPRLAALADAVRVYAGDELTWELELVLARPDWRPLTLGGARLGWGSWLGSRPARWAAATLVIAPEARRRAASAPRAGAEPPAPHLADHPPEPAHV